MRRDYVYIYIFRTDFLETKKQKNFSLSLLDSVKQIKANLSPLNYNQISLLMQVILDHFP